MADYVTFDAKIEPMEWGTATYTVLRLGPDVMKAPGPAKQVEGEFAEHPVNLAVTKAPVMSDPFLYTGKTLLDRTGITPGEVFEARLRLADPDQVDVPQDVMNALRSAGHLDAWEGLTPGKKRGLLHTVETAKRAETRTNRITKLLASLT